MKQYVILSIVSLVILVGLWDSTHSLPLFLISLTMLAAGLVATHLRTKRTG